MKRKINLWNLNPFVRLFFPILVLFFDLYLFFSLRGDTLYLLILLFVAFLAGTPFAIWQKFRLYLAIPLIAEMEIREIWNEKLEKVYRNLLASIYKQQIWGYKYFNEFIAVYSL